jgi:glycosyltransferase EpsD
MHQLQELGYEVWCATDKDDYIPYANQIRVFPFSKKLSSIQNILTIFRIRKLLMDERFEKISTNTALASAIIRLAVMMMPPKLRPDVFYICHGFLFHENDNLKKWIYLLPEIICRSVTTVLMVMNQEDYAIAQKYHLSKGRIQFIDGIGIDLSKFQPVSEDEKIAGRHSLGFSPNDHLFIYAAEFSKRKNQKALIRAFTKASPHIPNAHLLFAGTGILNEECKALVTSLDMNLQIHFLGFVKEMYLLYPRCDTVVSSSKIEGLPFNIMEAMSCGLSILASDIKGHRDLIGERTEALFQTEDELCEKLIRYAQIPIGLQDWGRTLEPCMLSRVLPTIMQQYMQVELPVAIHTYSPHVR